MDDVACLVLKVLQIKQAQSELALNPGSLSKLNLSQLTDAKSVDTHI